VLPVNNSLVRCVGLLLLGPATHYCESWYHGHEWFAWYVHLKPEGRGCTYQANHEYTLANWNQLKPGSMQVCNPIVFIGKVVRIDCGFSLTVNFQCITFIVKDTHFDCGFWYHFCTAKYHNIIPQSNLTTLPINWVELSLCNITKLNTTSESYKLCYINKQWTGVFCNWFLWIES